MTRWLPSLPGGNRRHDKHLPATFARSRIQVGLHVRGGAMSDGHNDGDAVRRIVNWRVFTGVLCFGLAAGAVHSPSFAARAPLSTPINDKQAVIRTDQALAQSLAKGDKSAVGQLLDVDFTWTDAAGKTQTKAQVLQAMVPGKAPDWAMKADTAPAKDIMYAQVGVLEQNAGRLHILRVWVKRPAGWRELVYQEVKSLDAPATVTPGAGKDCDNPCKSIPYEPKNEAERGVVTG